MISRRKLLVLAPVALVVGCRRKLPELCNLTTGLSPEQANQRAMLGYVDKAPDGSKSCEECSQFVASNQDGACGACKLLAGSIHPRGWCKAWSMRF